MPQNILDFSRIEISSHLNVVISCCDKSIINIERIVQIYRKEAKPMANSERPEFRAFRTSREYFTILGISPILIDQPYPFNRKIIVGFLILALASTSNILYVIYKAETFGEYTQSIYLCSVSAIGSFGLAMLVFRVESLFTYILNFENVINTSE